MRVGTHQRQYSFLALLPALASNYRLLHTTRHTTRGFPYTRPNGHHAMCTTYATWVIHPSGGGGGLPPSHHDVLANGSMLCVGYHLYHFIHPSGRGGGRCTIFNSKIIPECPLQHTGHHGDHVTAGIML